MHTKVVPVGSWDFGVEPTQLIKVASTGLRGEDRDALEKRAASPVFANIVDNMELGKGDIPIHMIAIGAKEAFGCNRNGDAWDIDTCQKQAHTFESRPLSQYKQGEHNGARFFMHHKNKDPNISYGYVKAAEFNEPMKRIELLIIGNGTKEAAERNGGFVIPDHVLDKLHDNEFIGGSMACKVAYDVCSICGNKAPSRKYYCKEAECVGPDGVKGLGCKHNLGRLLKHGRQQFVDNPNAVFFDYSYVGRPADRTAYGGVVDYQTKSASLLGDERVIGGAELAELYEAQQVPSYSDIRYSNTEDRQVKLARVLADLERHFEDSPDTRDFETARAFVPRLQPPLDWSPLGEAGPFKMAAGLRALADANVLLTLEDFLTIACPAQGSDKLAAVAGHISAMLPGVFSRLADSDDLRERVGRNVFRPAEELPPASARAWATKVAETRGCSFEAVQSRVCRSALQLAPLPTLRQSSFDKLASDDDDSSAVAAKLAEEYALYKLATLAAESFDSSILPLTAKLCVLQNYAQS